MKQIELRNIIDTWNMIDKYNVIDYKEKDSISILVSEAEYNRMMNASKNKEYIKNLRRNG